MGLIKQNGDFDSNSILEKTAILISILDFVTALLWATLTNFKF